MQPCIGLTCFDDQKPRAVYTSLSKNYSDSVIAAGGIPLLIPVSTDTRILEASLDRIDGLLFTGGGDLAPWRFGQEPIRQLGRISSRRDECELTLFESARRRRMPVFGICRGLQLINVAMGGDLYQDLGVCVPGIMGHQPEDLPMDELYHSIRIEEAQSIAGKVFGTGTVLVNSFHHQAINRLGPGLRATAHSTDGIIEACEASDSGRTGAGTASWYLSAVQFHPEALVSRYPAFLGLFKDFIQAASAFNEKNMQD